jgi:hypothetical protein
MPHSTNYNLPGPGDFEPPDPPELDDMFIEQACAELNSLEEEPCWVITDQEVIDRAWELQDAADRQAALDAAEMQVWDAEDRLHGG